jgi:hypothetical protein
MENTSSPVTVDECRVGPGDTYDVIVQPTKGSRDTSVAESMDRCAARPLISVAKRTCMLSALCDTSGARRRYVCRTILRGQPLRHRRTAFAARVQSLQREDVLLRQDVGTHAKDMTDLHIKRPESYQAFDESARRRTGFAPGFRESLKVAQLKHASLRRQPNTRGLSGGTRVHPNRFDESESKRRLLFGLEAWSTNVVPSLTALQCADAEHFRLPIRS